MSRAPSANSLKARTRYKGGHYRPAEFVPDERTGSAWRDIIERQALALQRDDDDTLAAYSGASRVLEIYLTEEG